MPTTKVTYLIERVDAAMIAGKPDYTLKPSSIAAALIVADAINNLASVIAEATRKPTDADNAEVSSA